MKVLLKTVWQRNLDNFKISLFFFLPVLSNLGDKVLSANVKNIRPRLIHRAARTSIGPYLLPVEYRKHWKESCSGWLPEFQSLLSLNNLTHSLHGNHLEEDRGVSSCLNLSVPLEVSPLVEEIGIACREKLIFCSEGRDVWYLWKGMWEQVGQWVGGGGGDEGWGSRLGN